MQHQPLIPDSGLKGSSWKPRGHIDQPDIFGYDPLSAAAEEGMLEVVKILCRNRANVHLGSDSEVGEDSVRNFKDPSRSLKIVVQMIGLMLF